MTQNTNELITKCEDLLKEANLFFDGFVIKADTNYKLTLLYHFGKTKSILESIILLLKNNKWQDIGILFRSIFENHIDISYIVYDINERDKNSDLFVNYDNIIHYKLIKIEETYIDYFFPNDEEKEGFYKRNSYIENEYNKIRNSYTNESYWSGKNRHDMAHDIGMKKEYDITYRLLCIMAHPTPTNYANYIHSNKNNNLSFDVPLDKKCEDFINFMLVNSFRILHNIMKLINMEFVLNKKYKIDKLFDIIKEHIQFE